MMIMTKQDFAARLLPRVCFFGHHHTRIDDAV